MNKINELYEVACIGHVELAYHTIDSGKKLSNS